MDEILQFYGDLRGCGPFKFQDPHKSMQVNQHYEPPNMLLGGNEEESFTYNASNTGSATGQNNILAENNNMEETEQGWQRIRWTNEMVKILINAVSYYEDVVSVECCDQTDWNNLFTPIKGKWRSVSVTMFERGYNVSPQQCEDKFNDLNKKYKRLTQILGTDTSYSIVENPALMGPLNIPDETKDEVRKILTCKQLFFKEMYSYHTKNDTVICCLQDVTLGSPVKKRKPEEDNKIGPYQVGAVPVPEEKMTDFTSELIITQSLELEEKRLEIQMKVLELEKKKFEFLKLVRREDEELHQMLLDNKLMQHENERQAFMLKCQKRGN